jgi:hypothetical protein
MSFVNIASMSIFFSTACCAKYVAPSSPCSSPAPVMKTIVASNFLFDITRASSMTVAVPDASSFAPGASHFASVGEGAHRIVVSRYDVHPLRVRRAF